MSHIYNGYHATSSSLANILDFEVIKRLEEILEPPGSDPSEMKDNSERIKEIANELKSIVSTGSLEKNANDAMSRRDVCRRASYINENGNYEPRYKREHSTREKSRAYREKKKLKNEQLEKQLNHKLIINENLKKRIELLEQMAKILRNTINYNYKINQF